MSSKNIYNSSYILGSFFNKIITMCMKYIYRNWYSIACQDMSCSQDVLRQVFSMSCLGLGLENISKFSCLGLVLKFFQCLRLCLGLENISKFSCLGLVLKFFQCLSLCLGLGGLMSWSWS